jgi:hypothetical protein
MDGLMKRQTPVERLADYVRSRYETTEVFNNLITNLLHREMLQRVEDYNAGHADGLCNHINDANNYINEQNYLKDEDTTS